MCGRTFGIVFVALFAATIAIVGPVTVYQAAEGLYNGRAHKVEMNRLVNEMFTARRLRGSRCLVTGGNRGLGRGIATLLLSLGADVIVGVRKPSDSLLKQLSKEAAEIREREFSHDAELPLGTVSAIALDLSDLDSVHAATQALSNQLNGEKLDVLILNAAVMPTKTQLSKQGLELSFAVNYIGHVVFTDDIIDGGMLKSSKDTKSDCPGRIIVITSEVHRHAERLSASKLGEVVQYGVTGAMERYQHTKLLVVTYANELARHVKDDYVVTSMCPGPVNSEIARDAPAWATPFISAMMNAFFETPVTAAKPIAFMAGDTSTCSSFRYWHMSTEKQPSDLARDADEGANLWTSTQKILSDLGHPMKLTP